MWCKLLQCHPHCCVGKACRCHQMTAACTHAHTHIHIWEEEEREKKCWRACIAAKCFLDCTNAWPSFKEQLLNWCSPNPNTTITKEKQVQLFHHNIVRQYLSTKLNKFTWFPSVISKRFPVSDTSTALEMFLNKGIFSAKISFFSCISA